MTYLAINNGPQYPAWLGQAGIAVVVILIIAFIVWLLTRPHK